MIARPLLASITSKLSDRFFLPPLRITAPAEPTRLLPNRGIPRQPGESSPHFLPRRRFPISVNLAAVAVACALFLAVVAMVAAAARGDGYHAGGIPAMAHAPANHRAAQPAAQVHLQSFRR